MYVVVGLDTDQNTYDNVPIQMLLSPVHVSTLEQGYCYQILHAGTKVINGEVLSDW